MEEQNNQELTEMQKRFIEEYVEIGNASEAARRAGYSESTVRNRASSLLRHPVIRPEIEARLAEKGTTIEAMKRKARMEGLERARNTPNALTPKHRRFVELYITNGNGKQAAREAGYQSNSAARLLRMPAIQRLIEMRMQDYMVTADEAMIRLGEIIRADYDVFVKIDPETGKGRLDLAAVKAAGKLHLIKRIRETKYGLEIEFYDRLNALVHLMKVYGVFQGYELANWRDDFVRRGLREEEVEEVYEWMGANLQVIIRAAEEGRYEEIAAVLRSGPVGMPQPQVAYRPPALKAGDEETDGPEI